MKKLKCILTGILIIMISFSSINTPMAEDSSSNKALDEGIVFRSDKPDEYVQVYKNDKFTMSYKESISAIEIVDNISGKVWNSAVTQDLYDLKNSTKTWQAYMQSILAIKYVSKTDSRGNFINDYSSASGNTVSAAKLNKGLKLKISFKNPEIDISLKIELEDDGIKFSIPASEIKEHGSFSLFSAEVIPFFGAATKDMEGYIVYPDGSGALSYFNRTDNKHQYTKPYSLDIYSFLDHEKIFDETNEDNCAMLPIYGIKNGGSAFLAAITKGDSSAKININTSVNSSAVKLNRASFEFVYRNKYRIYLSNIIINGSSRTTNPYGVKVDKDIINQECEFKLFLLSGYDADYSGMANTYRKYLQKEGLLKESKVNEGTGLALNIFMGTREQSTLLKKYVKMTTFDEVKKFAEAYTDKGVSNLQIMLRGWSKNGYDHKPNIAKPDYRIGGSTGLKKLAAFDKENEKLTVFLETDMTSAIKSSGGFSMGRDVILNGTRIPVSDDKNEFIINSRKMESLYEKAFKNIKNYIPMGVALVKGGSFISHDYNKSAKLQRSDNIEVWKNVLSKPSNAVAVEGGNLYTLADADRLYDIPMESALNQISDERIPWYQMVLYGSIPYTGEPGNLSHDLSLLKLKWIEYGYMPYFEITERNPLGLKDTNYNILFTSENSKWSETIFSIYEEWQSKLKPILNTHMTKHERLTDNIIRITYENGYQVLINYSPGISTYDDKVIPARGYIITGGVNK